MNNGKHDDSELGGESAGSDPMKQEKVPTQEELNEDMKKNPSTEPQVGGIERDGGGG